MTETVQHFCTEGYNRCGRSFWSESTYHSDTKTALTDVDRQHFELTAISTEQRCIKYD